MAARSPAHPPAQQARPPAPAGATAATAADNVTVAPAARQHELRFGLELPGGGRVLRWRGPALMGVINVTPDSFSDGGERFDAERAVGAGLAQHAAGALVVDVGGESTRPGAAPVPEAEERRRVVPVVAALAAAGVIVSIDSRNPEVVRAALDAGAHIVNDIGGLRLPGMRAVAAAAGAPVVVMHMQGEPRTMQQEPVYQDVVREVREFLHAAADAALAAGVPDVMLDPGIGFGKTVSHNLELLSHLEELTASEHTVLVGASRKSSIVAIAGPAEPKQRLPGTLVMHLRAADAGAAMLRVHDVAEHVQALKVWGALQGTEYHA